MNVTAYLFFCVLIAVACGANSNEENGLGRPTSDISVQEAPYLTYTKSKSRIFKPVGNMLKLKCKAEGNPTPNITWYKNDEIPKPRLGNIRYRQWSLTVEDLVSDDSGIYRCVVCNSLGCVDFNYTVEVVERYHNRPILTDPAQNKTAVVGSNVTFSCTFLSDVHPEIYWVIGAEAPGIGPPGENGTVTARSASEDPSILELVNVTYDSEGWYTCVGVNSLGYTSSSAYLEVVGDTSD